MISPSNSPLSASAMKKLSLTVTALVAIALVFVCLQAQPSAAYSVAQQDNVEDSAPGNDLAATLAVIQNPKQTINVLENLLRSIVFSSNELGTSAKKRGLDLGMSRGFSGSQAGKHLMGLSAANFANGPGK